MAKYKNLLINFIVSLFIVGILYLVQMHRYEPIRNLCDAFFITAALYIFSYLWSFLVYQETFYFVQFGTSQFIDLFRRDKKIEGRYPDYVEEKRAKKKPFKAFNSTLIIFAFYLILSIIFMLII